MPDGSKILNVQSKASFKLSWDFLSRLIVAVFLFLQFLRWRLLPQSMDIYYHLMTAWGFNQAGGWNDWDFWQYAPQGRVHIYPPLLHLAMGSFLKAGIPAIILAKVLEAIVPVVFLFTAWKLIRRNFGSRLGFFSLLMLVSSQPFFINLVNHLPSTLALIFGLISFDRLLSGRRRWAAFFLSLAFYTHIGISWFFALAILIYAVFSPEERRNAGFVLAAGIMFSVPVIFRQFQSLSNVSGIGLNLYERNLIQFKIVESLLAVAGLLLILKKSGRYHFFPALLLAGLIFVFYPYRYFCAEGYLPLAFFAAFGMNALWDAGRKIRAAGTAAVVLIGFIFLFSPSIIMEKPPETGIRTIRLSWAESAFTPLAFPLLKLKPLGDSMWLPQDYLPAAEFIRANSRPDQIIYSNLNAVGVILGGISGRATANALFPEIKPRDSFDPFAASRIIVITRDTPPGAVEAIVNRYKLKRFAANRLFTFYRNDSAAVNLVKGRVIVPSWAFWMCCLVLLGITVPTLSGKNKR